MELASRYVSVKRSMKLTTIATVMTTSAIKEEAEGRGDAPSNAMQSIVWGRRFSKAIIPLPKTNVPGQAYRHTDPVHLVE